MLVGVCPSGSTQRFFSSWNPFACHSFSHTTLVGNLDSLLLKKISQVNPRHLFSQKLKGNYLMAILCPFACHSCQHIYQILLVVISLTQLEKKNYILTINMIKNLYITYEMILTFQNLCTNMSNILCKSSNTNRYSWWSNNTLDHSFSHWV